MKFFSTFKCDTPDSADKGVELAVGNWGNDGYWIPLIYFHQSYSRREEIRIGEFTNTPSTLRIRGYDVRTKLVQSVENVTLELCDPAYFRYGDIQFRWLETSRHPNTNVPPVDVWMLDDVTIELNAVNTNRTLLQDNLDSSTQLK